MKTAVFDIETGTLSTVGPGAAFYCAVFKPLDSDKIILHQCHLLGQRGAISKTIETLSKFDMVIGHNVDRFDMAMLFSWAGKLGLSNRFPNPLIYDTMKAFGRIGYCTTLTPKGYRSKSLAMAIDYFWPEENDKTKLYPNFHARVYDKGAAGKRALQFVIDHCICDVMMNERLYWRILPDDKRAIIKRWR